MLPKLFTQDSFKSSNSLDLRIPFDALRVIALFTILFGHSSSYIGAIPILDDLRAPITYAGLASFFFLSGFGLQQSTLMGRDQACPWWISLQRRLIRIYPLYIVSIILYIITFHYLQFFHPENYTPVLRMLICHLASVQMLLFPKTATALTIWFVGVIVPYYIVYTIIRRLNNRMFLITALLAWSILIGVKVCLELNHIELIDTRLISYFPIFIFGCTMSRYPQVLPWLKNWKWILFPILTAITTLVYFRMKILGYQLSPSRLQFSSDWHTINNHFSYIFYCFAGVLSLVLFVFMINQYLPRFSKIISWIATLSYAAYLFHRLVLPVIYTFLWNVLGLTTDQGTWLYPLAIFLLLGISWLIVKLENRYLRPAIVWSSQKNHS